MASVAERKEALERWKSRCELVRSATAFIPQETPAEKDKRIRSLLKDYNAFVEYYFPHFVVDEVTGKITHCAPFHLEAARLIRDNNNLKAVFQWARGHAKSTHLDIFIPMYLIAMGYIGVRYINVMVLVGKSLDNAKTLISDIQAELENNQRFIADFGTQVNQGSWEDGKFVTQEGVAFFALGRGQSPRGLRYRNHRPDYIVIDDLDDDELVLNKARVARLTEWVREALFGTLDGGRGRFIMAGNLIARNSVLYNISQIKSVHTSRVNILTSKDEVSWASKWSREEVRAMEEFMSYRSFNKEYMNNPILEGTVFHQEWIRYKRLPKLSTYSDIVLYIDPSWRETKKNDYKAAKLWGATATGELHCIRPFLRQCSIAEMVRWVYDVYEWVTSQSATLRIYMEASFMQDILLDDFTAEGNQRGYQLPITGDKRQKPNKYARIEAVSPLWERGKVYYNEAYRTDPDMVASIEQTLSFEAGSSGHDDGPDADEGAIWLLQRRTRTQGIAPILGRRPSSGRNRW